MLSESLELDHIAINVKDNMDEAYELFSELGFILTPRGYHSLGSINHSMVFNNNYLELIGNQKGKPIDRPELKNAAFGINGLVFKTNNVHRIYDHLVNINFEQDAPRSFNRPVFIDDIENKAMFETVSIKANIFKAGRVYYCNHLTPNLVWIPRYMNHPNTSFGIEEIIMIDDEPKSIAEKFTKICKKLKIKTSNNQISLKTKDLSISIVHKEILKKRYKNIISEMKLMPSMFGAVKIKTKSFDFINNIKSKTFKKIKKYEEKDKVQIFIKDYNFILEFI